MKKYFIIVKGASINNRSSKKGCEIKVASFGKINDALKASKKGGYIYNRTTGNIIPVGKNKKRPILDASRIAAMAAEEGEGHRYFAPLPY